MGRGWFVGTCHDEGSYARTLSDSARPYHVARSNSTAEEERLRQHFRDHWYGKERAFGRFYLNLPHYRQILLLHQWEIKDYEDATYVWECGRDSRFAMMMPPPTTALCLHELVKFFENYGINQKPTPDITLATLPNEFDKRFGNAANWGDYLVALPNPEVVLTQLLQRVGR